ncbi:TetR family transcriptional regulator [Streptomyces sp. CSDS2]|uniref:TetR/AcrR family transcriptional regulator n=1 Tax=Streptomyces sp. CSDS2 TaxID=3055051 RepID=UPI0025B1866E|nr:TetR family transcriptional regulator [Streptomyces sp. CSDS2]MDN3259863.1 TetR family transcriptional regulator [Streptomyces sp. CSDS2]
MILDAARTEFSARGFEGTTMRAIARAAGVDAALIHHFFLSKGGLFSAAVQDVFDVPGLPGAADGPREGLGERLAQACLTHWQKPAVHVQLVALLRSATAFDGGSGAIQEFFGKTLLPVASAAGQGQADLRASLCGSYLLGVAAMRHVSPAEPIASLSRPQLVRTVGRTCQSYLCERL